MDLTPNLTFHRDLLLIFWLLEIFIDTSNLEYLFYVRKQIIRIKKLKF